MTKRRRILDVSSIAIVAMMASMKTRLHLLCSIGITKRMVIRNMPVLVALTILTGSLQAADIVIKPFGTVASTEYSTTYTALKTISDSNSSIDTGDPVPGTWPTLSVSKTVSWINESAEATADAWIAYDLGAYYTITGAQFWRYGSVNSDRLLKDFHILFAESLSGDFPSAAFDINDFSGAVTPAFLELSSLSSDPGVHRTFTSPVGMAVRYVLIDIDTNHGDASYVGLGEVRFTGTEATDIYPPDLDPSSPFYPPDNEVNVSTNQALVATFSEPVETSDGGSITITDLTDGSSTETITLPDTRVTVSGADLTIQPPSAGFESITEYSVRISTNAVQDLATPPNFFGGITDDTTWTVTTVDADQFVIEPINAAASSEFDGRPAIDAINSHGVDSTIIETGDPIPYPWPTASTSKTESWMTLNVGTSEIGNQWITFDLGDVYTIDGIYLWNYLDVNNGANGIKDVDILFATSLSDTFGSGTSVSNDYSASISKTFAVASSPHEGELVGFDSPVAAQYVLFDIASNYGNPYVGLAEIRFIGTSSSSSQPQGTLIFIR